MKEIDNEIITIEDFQKTMTDLLSEYIADYKKSHSESAEDFPLKGVSAYHWYADFDCWLEMRAARNEFCKYDT